MDKSFDDFLKSLEGNAWTKLTSEIVETMDISKTNSYERELILLSLQANLKVFKTLLEKYHTWLNS
ncbi:hypothetical protein [Clostridium sp.]|uniref:hypothetical protein n=1 Tax=Clostridium sp. TaxID=1506 RepID=UPI00290AFC93|nr:hypothetical protein [Clostridium sp.]MDU4726361.1 hypothetical protein [Clostridium sp.]